MASTRKAPAGLEAAGLVAVLALIVGLMLLAFGLPSVKGGPHGVPLGVVAPPANVAAVTQALDQAVPGGFDVRTYGDEQALRAAIGDRDVYGGFVFGARAGKPVVHLLTAGAASPAIAQGLTAVGTALGTRAGATVIQDDVRPLPADDPRGAGLAAVGLPLVIGGLLPAVLLTRRFPGRPGVRVLAALAFALVEGPLVASILNWWFGSIDGNVLPVAAGLSFGMAAVSLTVLGLESLLGVAGLGLGGALFVLLGNPLSGIAAGPEFLPAGWGTFGQLMPPGASATLLRSDAFFDGAGAARPLVVLSCWVAGALVLNAAAGLRNRRRAATPPIPAEVAAEPRPALA
ncbi:ABC transporter permease [Cryptosporangium sp. NPDC051539]|uniref:ABC transporter permease n=1 Tax=Cryptosporangium sp. NPDC051539 TaxID=3363962 RepID=UPI0037B99EA8